MSEDYGRMIERLAKAIYLATGASMSMARLVIRSDAGIRALYEYVENDRGCPDADAVLHAAVIGEQAKPKTCPVCLGDG